MDQSDELLRVRDVLRKWNQHHVLERLDITASTDATASANGSPRSNQQHLLQQLLHFERWYPNGVDSYLRTATQLFREQQRSASATSVTPTNDAPTTGSDPFASWVPTIPHDSYGLLDLHTPKLHELEAIGLEHAEHCAFVVVAGGLGERLGYNGIKLALPVETITKTSYIETYIRHIQALQVEIQQARGQDNHSDGDVRIPLAIMTSDATHDATQSFLSANDYFDMPRDQITLLKQDTVPCVDAVVDADAPGGVSLRLVVDPKSGGRLVMKPHGHGDVHTLLHTSGLAAKWLHNEYKKHIHFIQDTNAPILNSALPLLGATASNKWKWAFTVVPRKAKDASGAIVQFTSPSPGAADKAAAPALFNVEYHELDHFLRTKAGDAFHDGDTNDPNTGFSPFPGNINHFVADLQSYVHVLGISQGLTPEIFNPKYNAQNGLFKSPARLECMMQDLPKLLVSSSSSSSSAMFGLLSFPSSLVYSPCKNDTATAATKARQGVPPQCACSSEHDLFSLNRAKLGHLGVHFMASEDHHTTACIAGARHEWLGIPVDVEARGPHVVWTPSFAVSMAALTRRFPYPANIHITTRSTLVVEGGGAHALKIQALRLDGALKISLCEGASVEIHGLRVTNAGYEYSAVDANAANADAVDVMRGYRLEAKAVETLSFESPGHYTVDEQGISTKK